jgi:CheY-like chemotaxis protein
MSPHILLVDDDVIASSALKIYLEAQHYTVTLAEDCRHASEALHGKQKIDLMILDYLMPDGNGTELLQTIVNQKSCQRPPVIMASSIIDSRNPGWQALFHRLSPTAQSLIRAFVSKPYPFKRLQMTLRKTLKIRVLKNRAPQLLIGDYT